MRSTLHRVPALVVAILFILVGRGALALVPGEAATIVVLGDSLSAGYGLNVADGWVALLATRLEQTGYGYHVVNASVSGETTQGALARLPHILEIHRPAIVIVELGGNDGLRGLPVPEARANLERIVSLARQAGATPLVLGMRMPPNFGAKYTEAFAAMYQDVARSAGAPLVPFLLASIADDDSNFQADRIHPTKAAQPALVDAVWPVLVKLLKKPAPTPAHASTPHPVQAH